MVSNPMPCQQHPPQSPPRGVLTPTLYFPPVLHPKTCSHFYESICFSFQGEPGAKSQAGLLSLAHTQVLPQTSCPPPAEVIGLADTGDKGVPLSEMPCCLSPAPSAHTPWSPERRPGEPLLPGISPCRGTPWDRRTTHEPLYNLTLHCGLCDAGEGHLSGPLLPSVKWDKAPTLHGCCRN